MLDRMEIEGYTFEGVVEPSLKIYTGVDTNCAGNVKQIRR